MARDIQERPCDFCPSDCHFMALEVDTNYSYANNEIVNVSSVMTCIHEKACAMWSNRDVSKLDPCEKVTDAEITMRLIDAGLTQDKIREIFGLPSVRKEHSNDS